MPERLSALDASFLSMEDHATPRHVGGVAVFDRADGFDFDAACVLIDKRLGFLPRYRQRVAAVPGKLARPVWIDDTDFDLNYHVRRSGLPQPGTNEQLFDLVARLMARPLDTSRPLWEAYFVEGLEGDRVALVTKTHQAVVDGIGTIDLAQLILDPEPADTSVPELEAWRPRRPPSSAQLVWHAVSDTLRQPALAVERVRHAALKAARVAEAIGGVTSAVQALVSPTAAGPLRTEVGSGRVFVGVRTCLDDYRAIRATHGGTVNDIVVATIAGALRGWFAARGEDPPLGSVVRALIPMAVTDAGTRRFSPASLVGDVDAQLVDLPIGEPDPVMRLQHISHAMSAHVDSGRSVAARALLRVGGFAPPTMHSLGARTAGRFAKRVFGLVITNSPGPQQPMYAGDAKMVEMFPIMPLMPEHALAIGVTSYDGGVYFGLNGDRRGMADIDVLAQLLRESLGELRGEPR